MAALEPKPVVKDNPSIRTGSGSHNARHTQGAVTAFLCPALAAYRPQIRLIKKCLEVFIGVTVVSSLDCSIVFGFIW